MRHTSPFSSSLLLPLLLAFLRAFLVGSPAALLAQAPVEYNIEFPNRAHHEAEVTVTFRHINPGTLELRMSRTSPGRYALHEFAKNVYNFRATGLDGRDVTVTQPNNHQWDVSGHGGEVTVRYTLFADHADGTYTGIDRTHGHLNMPSTFLWARGMEAREHQLTVRPPTGSGWRVATQLAATADPFVFLARDLAYFLDSPTEVSDFWEHSWQEAGQTFRIALHHEGSEADAERYAAATAEIVRTFRDVYGELPRFDHGTYTFLADYLPWVAGDGMEHRNSTVLTSTGSLARNMDGLLGTVAHEFFHAWNVERIRPATLEPFDFENANMSMELWFAEGFTSYYDDLNLWRSGLIDDASFAGRVGGMANALLNSRGRRFFSAVEMSMQAPFVDAATAVDPNNRSNTFLSYYTWGSAIALGLDLTLRTRFEGVTLDHLMREMWDRHGRTERPYAVADVEAALAAVTRDPEFARSYFDRFVRARESPDYTTLMAAAGLSLAPVSPGRAWLGSQQLSYEDGALLVSGGTLIDSPLYDAGVDRGDRVVSLDGRRVASAEDLREWLASHRPGQVVPMRFGSRGTEQTVDLTLIPDPTLSASLTADGSLTLQQRALRGRWKSATAR